MYFAWNWFIIWFNWMVWLTWKLPSKIENLAPNKDFFITYTNYLIAFDGCFLFCFVLSPHKYRNRQYKVRTNCKNKMWSVCKSICFQRVEYFKKWTCFFFYVEWGLDVYVMCVLLLFCCDLTKTNRANASISPHFCLTLYRFMHKYARVFVSVC